MVAAAAISPTTLIANVLDCYYRVEDDFITLINLRPKVILMAARTLLHPNEICGDLIVGMRVDRSCAWE